MCIRDRSNDQDFLNKLALWLTRDSINFNMIYNTITIRVNSKETIKNIINKIKKFANEKGLKIKIYNKLDQLINHNTEEHENVEGECEEEVLYIPA